MLAGLLAGCGDAYRPTIGTIYPVPVPTQPEYLPVVASSAASPVLCAQQPASALCASQGEGYIVDASGDSIPAIVSIGSQPVALAVANGGGYAYIVNLGSLDSSSGDYQGSVSSFNVITNPKTGSVNTTTLDSIGDVFAPYTSAVQNSPCDTVVAPEAVPVIFPNANLIYVSQTTQTSGPILLPLSRNVSGTGVPSLTGTLPMGGVVTNFTGLTNGNITYTIETDANEVQVLDSSLANQTTSPTIKASLTNGFSSPNFGVTSPDGNRVFILNCNGTVTTINGQTYSEISNIAIPPAAGQTTAGVPIWGDFVNSENLLVTVNTTSPDTILPSSSTTATQPGPGSLTVINAVEDTSQFGQIEGTVAVGVNPSGVAVLQESAGVPSAAYVANEGDDNTTAIQVGTGTVPCDCKTVSVVTFDINGIPQATPQVVPLYYSQANTNGTSFTTETCPANPIPVTVGANTFSINAPSSTGYPLQIVVTPDVIDQQVFVLCDQPSSDGVYYIFAIRTYSVTETGGSSSPANEVVAAIPVTGVPTQIKMPPVR